MPETFKFVEDRFAPPAPLPSTTQDTSKLETFDFIDELEPVSPAPEVEKFEEMVTEYDRDGKQVSLPVYSDSGKRLHRPKYEKDTGRMTHNERGIMTYDEWLKQKNEGGDWWRVAKDAVTHLAGGFTKIPGKIKEEGVMEASANIPESFLAAMEGLRMIGGGVGRWTAKPFRTEEEENKAEYEAYAEFGDQIFRQLELRKSRMGDVARMFGAKELAEVYDDGIDPEVADSLSLIFDPTYLVGGGLVKVGAAGMRQVPKVTNKYAKQMIKAAGKAAETKLAKEALAVLANPVTKTVSGSGKAGEMLGRGLQQAGQVGEKFFEKAPIAGTVVGVGGGYLAAPEGRELEYVLSGAAAGGAGGLAFKNLSRIGETTEKAAQRIGGAAEAARINSVRVSGLGTVAKTRPMREEVAKQFVTYDNRVANRILQEAGKLADTATVGAGMGAGLGSFMPTDPNNPGWAAGLGIGTFAAPAGMYSAKALNQLARVEIGRGGVPSADLRLRIKETPDHQLASEAVVKRFVDGLPEEQRVRFVDPDRGLSVHDMATQAEAVNWAMGAKRYAGKDVDLFVGNAQEVVAETGNPFHETVAGFWDDQTNKIYINTDAEVSTMTLLHEVFHPTETWSSRQKKLDTELDEVVDVDPLQDLQTDMVQSIAGTYAPDGSQMKAGLYSADELGKLIDQYNSKLYPDQTSNIIAKKAEIAAEFKKSGGAETPDLALMNRELDELTIKQDNRATELAAFDLLPESEKRKHIAREILSEQFAMFGESARHGIIRKARNTVLKKDYFRDKFLGMEIDRLKFNTLGRVRKTLEQVGVKFDLAGNPRGDMTATSVIFKDPKTKRQMVVDPGVEHLIAQYIIEKDKLVNRVSETSEVGGSEVTFKASDAAKKNKDGTPKVPRAIIERWAESGWVKTDKDGDIANSTGGKWQPGQRPAFTTAKERTRMDKDRVAALVAALEPVTKQVGDEEESVGVVRWRETDGGGKNFSGSYFDDAQMKAIMDAPDDVVQPAFKKNIEMLNEAVKTREGQPFLADYWKAITGKGYDSKARMKVQLFTPIGMEISSAGNFNATIFNIGYFENKINRWLGQSGKKKFWKEWADEDGRVDVDAFRRDVTELLGTHFADDRNVRYPDNTKKEKMYSFLGVKPFLPGRKDWNTSVKDRKMIQKFRADRMKNLTPGMGDNFPINYGKARARYMPGDEVRKITDKTIDSLDEVNTLFMEGDDYFFTSGNAVNAVETIARKDSNPELLRIVGEYRENISRGVEDQAALDQFGQSVTDLIDSTLPRDQPKYMPGGELTPAEMGVRSPADGQRKAQTDLRSGRFRVDSPTGGAGFHAAIADAAQRHKFGAAVEVKQPEFYLDPETKLFLEPDESAGLAITPGRDLVSVFKKPESQANVREILAEAAPYASTLDAFDVGGFLPNLYAENGFRPAARVPWNAEYAPPNWPKEMGEPDVVLMVRDPENVLGLPETDYNQARDQVPLFNDYDAAMAVQHAARAKVDEVGVSDAKYMPAGEPVTHRGREVADWSPEDFADFGKQFGVDNFGPQSKIMPVADQDGKSVNLPGGLDGEFTFYDLLWLKANPIDPSTLSKSLTSKLQQKLVRSVTPEPGDRVEVFNRFLFGMLSPNQPLTPNEFEFAAMRVRTPEDIDQLASFIDWEPGDKVDRVHRKEAEQKMTEFYETQAAGAGGMGLKGSADYTNLAEFAKLYKKDPDFFTKKPEESWDQFVEKVMTQTRGLSAKVASFSTVWQDPAHAAISAIDRHMARNFLPKLFPTKKSRQQFERSVVKRWNSLVDARRKLDSKFQKTVTKYNRTKKANRSPELNAEYDKYKAELKKLPKAPKSELKKVRNMDEVFRVQGGDAAFMDRVMSVLSSNERKFESRGGRNPMVPDYLHDVDWINRPDKASVIGDAYRQALAENDRRAQQSGLHLFASQWHLWDRIRRRLEPHEVMFPGLHKIPGMNRAQLEKAMNVHKEAGYWSSVKEAYREPTTGEIEMRMKPTRPMPSGPASAAYFMPATPGTRTPTPATPTGQPVKLVMDKIYRLPEREKEERKDRAMELLKKFAEQ